MRKLIYIISAVLLLTFGAGVNAGSCFTWDECKVEAEQGGTEAQYELGKMYKFAMGGIAQDYKKAFEWYSKAAEQGYDWGQYAVGWAYYDGTGVPQDYVMAHMFCNLAAASGSGMGAGVGARCRGVVAKKMTPSQIQEAQRLAREWMQKHQR
jgi:TPR repeat protein